MSRFGKIREIHIPVEPENQKFLHPYECENCGKFWYEVYPYAWVINSTIKAISCIWCSGTEEEVKEADEYQDKIINSDV